MEYQMELSLGECSEYQSANKMVLQSGYRSKDCLMEQQLEPKMDKCSALMRGIVRALMKGIVRALMWES